MSNLEVIKQGYAYFSVGDMAGWASLVAPDAEWVLGGKLPISGSYVGPETIIGDCFAHIPQHWPTFNVQIKQIYEVGNTAFVHVDIKADGLDSESIHMMRIENGKFTYFRAFDDTDSMRQAMVSA